MSSRNPYVITIVRAFVPIVLMAGAFFFGFNLFAPRGTESHVALREYSINSSGNEV